MVYSTLTFPLYPEADRLFLIACLKELSNTSVAKGDSHPSRAGYEAMGEKRSIYILFRNIAEAARAAIHWNAAAQTASAKLLGSTMNIAAFKTHLLLVFLLQLLHLLKCHSRPAMQPIKSINSCFSCCS